MSRTLRLPTSIEHDVFVVVWDRDQDVYILALPDGTTYDIGDAQEAFAYFKNTLKIEEMGQRAIDCARNFYTAVCLWKEQRCWGAETETKEPEYARLFKIKPDSIFLV